MLDVAIVGAGELGGLVAHVLARRNAVAEIRLIDDSDESSRIAMGKALDIMQAGPVERFATRVSGSTDLARVGGAAVVVLADRVRGGEWQGEDGLRLLERLRGLASNAIVMCAGAGQRDLLELGVRELHMPRTRLFGSAPEALAAAARAIAALEADGSPHDVALSVVGVPPNEIIVPWEEATIGGFAATRVLVEPARRRIAARVPLLWPPGPYALASVAARIVEAIVGRSRRSAVCFVGPDDSAGQRMRAAALPVRLGPRGIEAVMLPQLNARDRVALENAMML
jgi:malate dehydrogenase